MFEIWEMPNGKLRFIGDLEDAKGLEVKKPAPKRKPK